MARRKTPQELRAEIRQLKSAIKAMAEKSAELQLHINAAQAFVSRGVQRKEGELAELVRAVYVVGKETRAMHNAALDAFVRPKKTFEEEEEEKA